MTSYHQHPLSVELRVLTLCFVELTIGKPRPIINAPPVRPLMLACTAKLALTYQLRIPVPSAPNINGKFTVAQKYSIRCLSLFQSSTSGACTLVVRNAIANNASVLALLTRYKALATM